MIEPRAQNVARADRCNRLRSDCHRNTCREEEMLLLLLLKAVPEICNAPDALGHQRCLILPGPGSVLGPVGS